MAQPQISMPAQALLIGLGIPMATIEPAPATTRPNMMPTKVPATTSTNAPATGPTPLSTAVPTTVPATEPVTIPGTMPITSSTETLTPELEAQLALEQWKDAPKGKGCTEMEICVIGTVITLSVIVLVLVSLFAAYINVVNKNFHKHYRDMME